HWRTRGLDSSLLAALLTVSTRRGTARARTLCATLGRVAQAPALVPVLLVDPRHVFARDRRAELIAADGDSQRLTPRLLCSHGDAIDLLALRPQPRQRLEAHDAAGDRVARRPFSLGRP